MARETMAQLRKKLQEAQKLQQNDRAHIINMEQRWAEASGNGAEHLKTILALEDKIKEMNERCSGCRRCRRWGKHGIFSEGTAAIYGSMFDSPETWFPWCSDHVKDGWVRVHGHGRHDMLAVDHAGHVYLSGRKTSCLTTREERKYLRKGLLHLEQWHMVNPCQEQSFDPRPRTS